MKHLSQFFIEKLNVQSPVLEGGATGRRVRLKSEILWVRIPPRLQKDPFNWDLFLLIIYP